jgi:hypothetical protein
VINFNFRLYNPFSDHFNSGRAWNGLVGSSHKAWEVQIMETNNIVEFDFSLTFRQDHAGIKIELGLFGRNVSMQIYDTRHWNRNENKWMEY